MTRRFVVGFLFHHDRVLLVQKLRPDWQKGLLNGVGGKVEEGETFYQAMTREFSEETTLTVSDWDAVCFESGPPDYMLGVFRSHYYEGSDLPRVPEKNDAGESLAWLYLGQLLGDVYPMVGNLRWMIPLALDWRGMDPANIKFHHEIGERPSW